MIIVFLLIIYSFFRLGKIKVIVDFINRLDFIRIYEVFLKKKISMKILSLFNNKVKVSGNLHLGII
jgi:hypothetical protein